MGGAPAGPIAAAASEFTLSINTASGCSWTLSNSAGFITIVGANSGSGNGSVKLAVAANTGPPRQGSVTIAGQTFTVQQAEPCTASVSPASVSAPQSGGDVSIQVSAAATCVWTTTTSDAFITVKQGASGTGNATVVLAIAANSGAPRLGTASIAGTTVTVDQAGSQAGCTFTVDTPPGVGPFGRVFTIAITTAAGCAWTASTTATFITLDPTAGTGNGSVEVNVAGNPTGLTRNGEFTIAGKLFTVSQASFATCGFTLKPIVIDVPSTASTTTVTVQGTGGASCPYTAVSNASFVTVTGGGSGINDGVVTLSIAANTGAARTGTVTIAGQLVTVNQIAAGAVFCVFSVSPTSVSTTAAATTVVVTITVTQGTSSCPWTAQLPAPFISIVGPNSGVGNGTVTLAIAANTGPSRQGGVQVAGVSVTINQAPGPSPVVLMTSAVTLAQSVRADRSRPRLDPAHRQF